MSANWSYVYDSATFLAAHDWQYKLGYVHEAKDIYFKLPSGFFDWNVFKTASKPEPCIIYKHINSALFWNNCVDAVFYRIAVSYIHVEYMRSF